MLKLSSLSNTLADIAELLFDARVSCDSEGDVEESSLKRRLVYCLTLLSESPELQPKQAPAPVSR